LTNETVLPSIILLRY